MVNDHIRFSGGGDAAFHLEKKILEEAGHEVFTFSKSEEISADKNDKDIIFCESKKSQIRKIGKFIGNAKLSHCFKNTLDEIQPDFVKLHLLSKYPADIYPHLSNYKTAQILHGPNLFCATSWGALKRNSKPCEQGIGIKCYSRGCISFQALPLHINLYRRIRSSALPNVDAFYCPSKQLVKTAEDLGFLPASYFPLSVDPDFINVEPAYTDEPNILYVGAIIEQKGVYYLVKAMKEIIKKIPEAQLKIVGKGADKAFIEEYVIDNGLGDNVHFLGFKSRSEVLDLYKHSSLCVMPSIWREQFGLVGPEALACGVPCVGTNIGGIPEWLHDEKSGFLVPPRDSKEIADKVLYLLMNKSIRKQYGDYGREFVLKEFSLDRYKKNVLKQIEDV